MQTIDIIDYADIGRLIDSGHKRNVIIHLARSVDEVRNRETQFFDVFFVQSQESIDLEGYVSEKVEIAPRNYITILTKNADG